MKATMRLILLTVATALLWPEMAYTQEIRLGIIGTDTSHAVQFTRIVNSAEEKDHVAGARVVAAFRGGSPSYALSRDRIDGFTSQLVNRWNLPLVGEIRDLCPMVDGLLLLSVDPGTRELEFKQAAACGKPIFVDKPFAATLQSALAMAKFATEHHVAWFSASALRYSGAQEMHGADVQGADVWGSGALGQGPALDLTWYGIHSIEMLYAVLGPGVETVSRIHRAESDVMIAAWADGRTASIHLVRPDLGFGIVTFRDKDKGGPQMRDSFPVRYDALLQQILRFMQTGTSPVDPKEMLEIFAFMDAAQRSMQNDGTPVHLTQIR